MRTRLTFLSIVVGLLVGLCAGSAQAQTATPKVYYAGVLLHGGRVAEGSFPIFQRNRRDLVRSVSQTLNELNAAKAFPFDLIQSTDMQARKQEIGDVLSLAIVVTRDDVATEIFTTPGGQIVKLTVNVGLVAILYETQENDGAERNTVLYSFPLVGYSQSIDKTPRSPEEINKLFLSTANTVLKDYLAKRLQKISLIDLCGKVERITKDGCRIDFGAGKGLDLDQNVKFHPDNAASFTGKVIALDKQTATIKTTTKPTVGMRVTATNIKGLSDTTYQVVEAKISSPKAGQLFPEARYAPIFALWFSNFLADRTGKVVLPSRVGGEWDVSASGSVLKLRDEDNHERCFDLPAPKYPISLDLTGIAAKVGKSNDVNQVMLYKAWLKLTIPTIPYSAEFNEAVAKVVVPGMTTFEDQAVFFDLIHTLTEKVSREATL